MSSILGPIHRLGEKINTEETAGYRAVLTEHDLKGLERLQEELGRTASDSLMNLYLKQTIHQIRAWAAQKTRRCSKAAPASRPRQGA